MTLKIKNTTHTLCCYTLKNAHTKENENARTTENTVRFITFGSTRLKHLKKELCQNDTHTQIKTSFSRDTRVGKSFAKEKENYRFSLLKKSSTKN